MEKNYEIEREMTEIKIDNIKKFVDTQLDKLGMYDKIKEVFENLEETDEERIMNHIKEKGLIDEILESFRHEENSIPQTVSKKCLFLKLIQGRGFIDYSSSNKQHQEEQSYFQIDILFLGQRFLSKKIFSSSQFQIDQSFILEFNPLKLDIEIDFERLKKLASPIHIVIIQHTGDQKTLVATKSLEWRWALCYGSWKIEAEMYSPATLNKLNVGTLDVRKWKF
jgi:hypothetical protein